MYFKYITKIRGGLVAPVILGLFIWHSDWTPPVIAAVLDYAIPALAALVLLHEFGFIVYMRIAFLPIEATVVQQEDTVENKLPIKNYDVTFSFQGSPYTAHFSESIQSNDLDGLTHCRVLVQQEPPHAIFIDSFKLKYMHLIFAVVLVYMVYCYSVHSM